MSNEYLDSLIKIVLNGDKAYYRGTETPLSDDDYDFVFEKAKFLFPNHPRFTEEIGKEVDINEGEKIELPFVCGSLSKLKEDTVEKQWIEKFPTNILMSAKVDGVSLIVIYEQGKLVSASTRGDGKVGRSCLNKAKVFCPNNIKFNGRLVLRGEALLTEKLTFKNRRNGTAGLLAKEEVREEVKYIKPYFYEIMEGFDDTDQKGMFRYLERLGFNVPLYRHIENEYTKETLITFLDECKEQEYDVDGIVLVNNDYNRENILLPENKKAFKINETEGYKTLVKEIKWNTSRSGRVIPVVEVEPVEIDGVTINRATGHNAQFIIDNNVSVGSICEILRSGDVIPYILNVTSTNNALLPTKCSCGSELEMYGVDLVCYNGCQGHKIVEHFLTSHGAEYITSKTLIKLGIDSVEQLYNLDEYSIGEKEGFGVKRGEQIVNEIQKTLNTTPEKLLKSFGIPSIGERVSKLILKKVNNNMDKVFDLTKEELSNIKGIGDKIADKFLTNIEKFKDLYSLLKSEGLTFQEGTEMKLDGKIFTLTGNGNKTRNQYMSEINNYGGIVSGIKKSTNYLVTGDVTKKTTKLKKAEQYGVPIISYDELENMLK